MPKKKDTHLEPLIGEINAQLLERVGLEVLEPKDIKNRNARVPWRAGAGGGGGGGGPSPGGS